MGRIKSLIEENTANGTKVVALQIGDDIADDLVNGFFKPCNDQVDLVCQQLRADPDFANGYHSMGFSQARSHN